MNVRSALLSLQKALRTRNGQFNITNGGYGRDEGAATPSIWNLCGSVGPDDMQGGICYNLEAGLIQ